MTHFSQPKRAHFRTTVDMTKKCLNCGYERQPDEESEFNPASECPKCHAIYEKVDKWLLEKERKKAEELLTKKGKDGNSKINTAKYAGFGIRFCAGLIDFIIIYILAVVAIKMGASLFWGYTFFAMAGWLYYAFLESSDLQASVGKKALGLIAADSEGSKITFWKATSRYFLFLITIFNIGFLMILFTKKKQAFHDMITNTFVLGTRGYNPNQYKIFKHPSGTNEAVKQGFLWPAFFFTWIWGLFKKMWVLGAGVLIGSFVANSIMVAITKDMLRYNHPSDSFMIFATTINTTFIQIIIGIIFGEGGSFWREKNLVSRGFEQVDTVTAANPEGAVAIYLKAVSTER